MSATEGRTSDARAQADPVAVVRAFLAALEDLDVDRALELVSDDIVYQNVPLPPARGLDEFGRQMRWLQRYCTGLRRRSTTSRPTTASS